MQASGEECAQQRRDDAAAPSGGAGASGGDALPSTREGSRAEPAKHASLAPPRRAPAAAPPHAPQPQRPADPRLDFFSPLFDAALALSTPGLEPPVPSALPLDYLAKCRVLLPPEMEESLALAPPATQRASRPEAEAARARALARQAAVEARAAAAAAAAPPPALQALHDSLAAAGGPCALLASALARRARVRVITRHTTGVRGTATGFVRAFDRYLNLILSDVEEQYTVLLRCTRGGEADGSRLRAARRQEHRRRHLKLVFLRGEHVVLVAMAPPPPDDAARLEA